MENLKLKVLIVLELLLLCKGEGEWLGSACQTAVHQGRQNHMEDRVLCNLDVRIPFPGETGLKELVVGVVAVFDGHNGAEASEMASKFFLAYFNSHIYFLLHSRYHVTLKTSLPNKGKESLKSYPRMDESFRLEILKEALVRAIHDIDATFSMEASRYSLDSGSTAVVVLIAEGQILVANVGDSKALLCTEVVKAKRWKEKRCNGRLPHFQAKQLTKDHHLDRNDERSRVENAGGYVVEWGGVSRVNGKLAVSRAIGDVSFKSYGVVSTPELTDWQPLTANDSYLVVSSAGIFEKLSSQGVCNVLLKVHAQMPMQSKLLCSYSTLADCLVNTAFNEGSMDNMAAVLVPLRASRFSENLMIESRRNRKEHFDLAKRKKERDSLVHQLQRSKSLFTGSQVGYT